MCDRHRMFHVVGTHQLSLEEWHTTLRSLMLTAGLDTQRCCLVVERRVDTPAFVWGGTRFVAVVEGSSARGGYVCVCVFVESLCTDTRFPAVDLCGLMDLPEFHRLWSQEDQVRDHSRRTARFLVADPCLGGSDRIRSTTRCGR